MVSATGIIYIILVMESLTEFWETKMSVRLFCFAIIFIFVFIEDTREEHCIVALYEWIAKMGMVVCLCMRYDYKEQIKEKSGYQELFFFLVSFSSSFVRAASESGKL